MQTKTKLNIFDFTMIVVSLVIGMGIFRTPVNVAAAVPTPFVFFFVWLVGGLVALCGALTYAEIGSRFPVTGAYYKIFSYCYHPSVAFAVNCIILVSNAASLSGVALIGAEYITKVIAPNSANVQAIQISIAIFSIALFYGINLLGLRMSAKTQNVLTIIKISMILLLLAPLFFATQSPGVIPQNLNNVHPAFTDYVRAFGIGLIAVSFTYTGYQQTINFGADVENPRKNIPRGIFIGIFVIITLYLAINYAYVKVIGFENLKIFGARNEHTNVLTTSLSVFAAICVLIVFWAKEFDRILSFSIFLDCIGMATSAATIFILRKRTANLDETKIYTIKLYPLLPLIFITAYIFVAVSIFIASPGTALTALAVLAGFVILYFISKGNYTLHATKK